MRESSSSHKSQQRLKYKQSQEHRFMASLTKEAARQDCIMAKNTMLKQEILHPENEIEAIDLILSDW